MHRIATVVVMLAVTAALGGCAWSRERAAFARGVDLYGSGSWDAAAVAFEDALSLAPRSADLHVNLGAARLASGDYWGALASFDSALQLDPGSASAAFDRGLARARLGDVTGARLDWHHAMMAERDPAVRERMKRIAARESPLTAETVQGIVVPRGAGETGRTGVTVVPGPGPGVTPTAFAAVIPAPAPGITVVTGAEAPSALPGPAQGESVTALAARGVRRAFGDDRTGAFADLRAALARETDPARRQRLQALLVAAVAPTPVEVDACNRQAGAQSRVAPAPGASPASQPPAATGEAAAPVMPRPFSDADLLASADPGMRDNTDFRRAFLDCLRQRGF